MVIVAVVLFALAVVPAVVGIAALAHKLAPNRFVGVRTDATMRDDNAFRVANRVAAPTLIAAALLLVIGGVAALTVPGIVGVVAAVTGAATAFGTAGVGSSMAAKVADAMAPAASGGCGHECASCVLQCDTGSATG